MNIVKILCIMVLAVICHSLSAQKITRAQRAATDKANQIKMWRSKLALSDSSASKLYSIMDNYKRSVNGVMTNVQLSDLEKRKQVGQLIRERDLKVRALLRPQQADRLTSGS